MTDGTLAQDVCKEECVDYSVNFCYGDEGRQNPGVNGSGIAGAPERRCLDDVYMADKMTLAYEACPDVCSAYESDYCAWVESNPKERCTHERELMVKVSLKIIVRSKGRNICVEEPAMIHDADNRKPNGCLSKPNGCDQQTKWMTSANQIEKMY